MPKTFVNAANQIHALPHGLFRSLRDFSIPWDVRHGIKYGLAGVLAFFISQAARLDTPTWSVVTVFVLMLAQYVGAVAEKAFFRLVGTVLGGVSGYLITGSLQQEPLVFLPLIGLAVAFSITMFGQTRAPYAFFLFGLTNVVVASNGLDNPDMSWRVALTRTEEVSVGVIATLLVTNLVWPRFARVEFRTEVRNTLDHLGRAFGTRSARFLGEPGPALPRAPIESGLQKLGNLLHFGARESAFFRDRLPTYEAVVLGVRRLARTLDGANTDTPMPSLHREVFGPALEKIAAAARRAFSALAAGKSADPAFVEWDAARRELNAASDIFRRDRSMAGKVGVSDVLAFADWILAVDTVRSLLGEVARLLESLPTDPVSRTSHREERQTPPLDPFHIVNGVRAGMAVCVGLLIQDWLQPPGGSMVTLAVFVFSALTRGYPGGQGDLRAFHWVLYAGLGGILYTLAMVLLAPVMSSYAALNILTFSSLFLFGWLSFRIPGISLGMQLTLLGTVGTLGLNAQEPVSFQSIVGVPIGVVLGMLISALIQRHFWPVLPQLQLRDRLVEWISHCRSLLLPGSGAPGWRRGRLAVLPAEVEAWVGALRPVQADANTVALLRSGAAALGAIDGRLPVPAVPSDLPLEAGELDEARRLAERLDRNACEVLETSMTQIGGRSAPLEEKLSQLRASLELWNAAAVRARAFALDNIRDLDGRLPIYQAFVIRKVIAENALAFGGGVARIDWRHTMADAVL